MANEENKDRKGFSWREALAGLGLGSVVSFLTIQSFRKEEITHLEANLRSTIKEFMGINPMPEKTKYVGSQLNDILFKFKHEDPMPYVTEEMHSWNLNLKTYVFHEIGDANEKIAKLENTWKGSLEAFSRTSALNKVAICGVGVLTTIGSVLLINHFRNIGNNTANHSHAQREQDKKQISSQISSEL